MNPLQTVAIVGFRAASPERSRTRVRNAHALGLAVARDARELLAPALLHVPQDRRKRYA